MGEESEVKRAKGIYYSGRRKRWLAYFRMNGETIYVGAKKTQKLAIQIQKEAIENNKDNFLEDY